MASASRSAAGVPHLLQLAAGAGEPAARAQLQAAVLDLLLPPSAGPPSAEALLRNLASAVQQCSEQQVEQLRQAVQHVIARRGGATAAAVSSAVRLCHQRLHTFCSRGSSTGGSSQGAAGSAATEVGLHGEPGAARIAGGRGAQAEAGVLSCVASALFVLGPLSSAAQADSLASLAEARLLISSLQQLAQAGASARGSAASTLLACTALAWRQLGPACPTADGGSGSQPGDGLGPDPSAALGLAHASLPTLQALLLAPGCCSSMRRAALDALFALPPAAEAPLCLLRSLTAAATATDVAAAAGPAQLQLNADAELPAVVAGANGVPGPDAAAGSGSQPAKAIGAAAPPSSTGGGLEEQQVQQRALVALLDVLGGLAATYEQHKAAFLQHLAADAVQREREQAQRQQAAGQTSHFGRPLRPASEWWIGAGQPIDAAAGQAPPPSQAGAAAEGEAAAAADDYMRAEHVASEHEAAAQRYLESLLEAADTAPACYLPVMAQLAAPAAPAEGEGAGALPPAVQVWARMFTRGPLARVSSRLLRASGLRPLRLSCCQIHSDARLHPLWPQAAALRALGLLALLSEPLSQQAVAAAEAALLGTSGGGSGSSSTEVQAAAVALLADAIEAFPNRYSDRLLLIGRLMAPAAAELGSGTAVEGTPAECSAEGSGAGAAEDGVAADEQAQLVANGDGPAQPAARPEAPQACPAAPATGLPEQQEQLARAAAAAYCRLLLRNRLKLQGMLGPLGAALATALPPVAALVQHSLRQMLGAAAPKERARLCMALFHQTPLGCRAALAQVRLGSAAAPALVHSMALRPLLRAVFSLVRSRAHSLPPANRCSPALLPLAHRRWWTRRGGCCRQRSCRAMCWSARPCRWDGMGVLHSRRGDLVPSG